MSSKSMIPKYVEKLLERRSKLAENLISIILAIDDYCERIGIDMCDDSAVIGTNPIILSEPDVAYDRTKLAIEKALKENRAPRDKERECCEI